MNNFIWLDEYKIGNDTVDQQHQYLFDLANQIVDPNNDPQKTHLNVLSLHHYVREHFAYEEAVMKQCNFSGHDQHIKEHTQLIRKLNEIGTGIISGDIGPDYVMDFMRNWLLEHILKKDMAISEYINQQKQQHDVKSNTENVPEAMA